MLFSRKGAKGGSKKSGIGSTPPVTVASTPVQSWYGWAPAPATPTSKVSKRGSERPAPPQKIILQPGESIIGILPLAAVRPAQTAIAEIVITPVEGAQSNLRVLLIRNGDGKDPEESFKSFFKLNGSKTMFRVGGKFSFAHGSLRLEVKNVGESVAEFSAEQPVITIT